jgi:heme A synthase
MTDPSQAHRRTFARYARAVLAFNVAVVLWGALVRASGSGAGCGNHWPACNGQVIPQSPSVKTLIEFTHRLMTGADTFLVIALVVLAWRLWPRRSPLRKAAAASMLFLVTEALVGAALVKLDLVAANRSAARVYVMSVHLVNTFLLLASLTLTAWFASHPAPLRIRGRGAVGWALAMPIAATLAVAVAGAVTALGDTLFPASSLAAGLRADASPTAHFLVRLRVLHPALAVATGLVVVLAGYAVRRLRPTPAASRLSRTLVALFFAQLAAGAVNVVLLAPIWMQILHLLLADAVWITLVLTAAAALAESDISESKDFGVQESRSVPSHTWIVEAR